MRSPGAEPASDGASHAAPHAAAIYLALVQFLFATTWIVYVLFLPRLAETVGIRADLVIWILLLDQVVFVIMDFVMGVAADRVQRLTGRLAAPIVGTTLVSCLAFLLIPQLAGLVPTHGLLAEGLFFGLILIWSGTSSVLRAPPWVMFGKYASTPTAPWLAALALLGLAVANAIAPYLGLTLRDVDPRVPFALCSLTLLATTAGFIWVERALGGAAPAARAAGAASLESPPPVAADDSRPGAAPAAPTSERRYRLAIFLVGVTLLALGFQAHTAFNSAPQYLRFAPADDLVFLLPVFWIGFNIFSLPAASLAARHGELPVMVWAGALGAIGMLFAALAPSLGITVAGQLVAGGAWGAILATGLAAALGLGRPAREGAILGLWFSVQAVATVFRMALAATGLNKAPVFALVVEWLPPALWLGSALLLGMAIVWAVRAATTRLVRA